jgi:hypothetical protein
MNELLTAPPVAAPAAPVESPTPTQPAPDTFFRRLFKFTASLQLAITLLSTFALCLATATFLESAYGARLAQELVYRTWWFALLLVLLSANVLCAALKKYPWKRHQTGFLVTHTGLLVLLSGGLLTVLGGTEGQMLLIDSADQQLHKRLGLTDTGSVLGFPDRQRLEVFELDVSDPKNPDLATLMRALERGGDVPKELTALVRQQWAVPFRPGSLPWRDDEQTAGHVPWHLAVLRRLADPLPGSSETLAEGLTLSLDNFYPHTEHWPFRAAPQGKGLPALKLQLAAPMMPKPLERWVSPATAGASEMLPVHLELMRLHQADVLPEFLDPPAPQAMGPLGQLVIVLDGRTFRVPVHEMQAGKAFALDGRRQLTLLEYVPDFMDKDNAAAACPAVRVELTGPEGKTEATAFARLPHLADARGPAARHLALWYHFPDHRWGAEQVMGGIQFLQAPDGKLYFRVYGKDGLKQKGQAIDPTDVASEHELPWGPMSMRFRIVEYLPQAVEEPSFVARALRPGAEAPPRLRPVIRGKLTAGGRTADYWVRLAGTPAWVEVGGKAFVIRYQADTAPLDFRVTLKQARRATDPGTNRPASFESDVVLATGPLESPQRSEHTISMNQPLQHAGYRVYQTNFEPLTDPLTHRPVFDPDGRPVHLSGFTVARDPGLWFKYAGSALVVLGIATMFYMRAYFFRRPAISPR